MTEYLASLIVDPNAWVALATLVAMEIVLGIDNLIFISVLTNKLPPEKRQNARRIGIGGALILRLLLLGTIAFIIGLTQPVFEVFGKGLSWRDLILITGGLFLVWKATKEIHHSVDPDPEHDLFDTRQASLSVSAAIAQILVLDLVFSVDSIITAVGMTEHIPCRNRDVAGGDTPGKFHSAQPDHRHACAGFPAADRYYPHCGRVRSARAEGLHLCRDGIFGLGRRTEHAVAKGSEPAAEKPGVGLKRGNDGLLLQSIRGAQRFKPRLSFTACFLEPDQLGPDGQFLS
jgi:hypothetical protein